MSTTKYPDKESSTLELKIQPPSKNQIIKTVTAFCNLYGGRLVIGVDDQRNIIGIPEEGVDELMLSLQQSIYQSTSPPIIPSIYTQRIDNKVLLCIEVSTGMNKPYFVISRGLNEGTFIRIGASTMKATPGVIQELIWQSKGFSADEMPVYPARENDLDLELFKKFLNSRISGAKPTSFSGITDQLTHYRVLINEHQQTYPSIGGILLFSERPQKFFPEAFTICTHFKGNAGRNVIATQDCMGTVIDQINKSVAFVIRSLNQQFEIKNIQRTQQLEIPEEAIREVIINAITHRNYQLPGPIKIAIYDNRVEIFSPGNFPGPLDTSNLELGITYIRNHIISRVLREAGYIEKLGSGFLTLFRSYRKLKLPTPTVIEGAGFIKCILPRAEIGTTKKSVTANQNNETTELMQLFYQSSEITTQNVAEALGISRQTAARRLSNLVKQGIIERLGKGPSVRYRKI